MLRQCSILCFPFYSTYCHIFILKIATQKKSSYYNVLVNNGHTDRRIRLSIIATEEIYIYQQNITTKTQHWNYYLNIKNILKYIHSLLNKSYSFGYFYCLSFFELRILITPLVSSNVFLLKLIYIDFQKYYYYRSQTILSIN